MEDHAEETQQNKAPLTLLPTLPFTFKRLHPSYAKPQGKQSRYVLLSSDFKLPELRCPPKYSLRRARL